MTDHQKNERRSTDAQIGYLMGKVESLEEKFEDHISAEERHFNSIAEEMKGIRQCMDTRLGKIEEQLSMYRHFLFFSKMAVAAIIATIAIKWEVVKVFIDKLIHW